ncbi:MAG: hypothetical protein WC789_13450 [Lentisphaeria bacterium]|jgi:NAD+ kinase
MRVAICGRNLDDLRSLLRPLPLTMVEERPDLVISYGGDGALLGAEREWPGVPKLPLRDRRGNPKCPRHQEEAILEMLLAGQLREQRLLKLLARCGGRTLAAVNDIVIHNEIVTSAVRYRVWLDGELYANRVVGDGLIVATPFGSTGYYRSITHSLFRIGIGLAFNNSTEPTDHLVIREDSSIRLEILRGPAILVADNIHTPLPIPCGQTVEIQRHPEAALILGLDIFRCPACSRRRQENPDAT